MNRNKSNYLRLFTLLCLALFMVNTIFAQKGKDTVRVATIRMEENVTTVAEDTAIIFSIVEEMPQFPGGENAYNEFISKNIVYPKNTKAETVLPKVYIRFCVERDGSISRVSILRSANKEADNEAIRLIKLQPKWIPGKQNGKQVAVWIVRGINFKS